MDNTEHYGCFDKGSNPLGTSMFTKICCSRSVNRLKKWTKKSGWPSWFRWWSAKPFTLVRIQYLTRWLWSNGKTGVCGTSNKSSILFNHTIYCGEEGFPTGLISRVSRVRFSAPQQNIFKGIFLLKKLYLYLFQDNGFHHSTDVDNPEWNLKT